jgi:hypothetical protein
MNLKRSARKLAWIVCVMTVLTFAAFIVYGLRTQCKGVASNVYVYCG